MPAYCSVPSDFSYAAYCIRMCSEVFLMLKLREIDGKKSYSNRIKCASHSQQPMQQIRGSDI